MKRILIADDEEALQRLYQEEFEEEGYEVILAGNGREVLEKLDDPDRLPDLIVMDIRMPEMNGIDTLRIIKEKQPQIPVILCSAYSEFKQDFSVWASDDYVVKSSDLTELKAAVKRHLKE
ncbi:MAG: response regulator [Desulfobacterota bacterium]|jgi:CheY-like chemotaxis protein|nr:response regulator [Thermodesulfobacteriota bacterium]